MNRALLEIKRQALHIILGAIIVLLILTIEREIVLIILFLIFLLSVLLSIISVKTEIPVVSWFIKEFEREPESKIFPGKGIVFFLAGSLLTLKLFSQDIALASILVLTFGDAISTLAGFFGQKYAHKPFNRVKSLYGTLTGMIVSFLIALIFIEPIYAAVAAIFGMFAEAITIKLGETEADDNLIVPLAAGTACYLLRLVLTQK